MKKIKPYFFVIIAVAVMLWLSSCSKDDDPTPDVCECTITTQYINSGQTYANTSTQLCDKDGEVFYGDDFVTTIECEK